MTFTPPPSRPRKRPDGPPNSHLVGRGEHYWARCPGLHLWPTAEPLDGLECPFCPDVALELGRVSVGTLGGSPPGHTWYCRCCWAHYAPSIYSPDGVVLILAPGRLRTLPADDPGPQLQVLDGGAG